MAAMRVKLLSPLTLLGILCLGCADADSDDHSATSLALSDVVDIVGRVTLAESRDVINVVYTVTVDPQGGFLVSDHPEAQIRSYDHAGILRWHAGERGGGPGEFGNLMASVRLPSGEILALDRNDRITRFAQGGDSVISTLRTGLIGMEDIEVVSDSEIIVTGVGPGGLGGARIHGISLPVGGVVWSAFSPFLSSANPVAARTAGWTKISTFSDSMAAIFAVSDTVYFFESEGRPVDQIAIRSEHFRPVQPEKRAVPRTPSERAEWLGTFDMVADVWWVYRDLILVQYVDLIPGEALARRWHLLGMRRNGETLFEVRDTPRLHVVDNTTGVLFFADPDSMEPNRWLKTVLRQF